jgi:hypothetical protein
LVLWLSAARMRAVPQAPVWITRTISVAERVIEVSSSHAV